MRTITTEHIVYNYEDVLKDNILKKMVLEKNIDINVDFEWYEYLLDEWKEKLEQLGFINPEIEFTGFYSQGDGASFISDIDLKQAAKVSHLFSNRQIKILNALIDYNFIEANITRHTYRYSHENSTSLNKYDGELKSNWKHIQIIVDILWKYLEDLRFNLSKEIYNDLKNEYEYLTSEEAILDTIQANDYEFYADGTMI